MGNFGEIRSPKGFSYVDVLIGLFILALALLAFIPMITISVRQNAAAGDLTFSATLAHEKAEELRATPYGNLTAGTTEDYVQMRAIQYKRTWIVEADTPHPGMKKVTVEVHPLRAVTFGNTLSAEVYFYHVP